MKGKLIIFSAPSGSGKTTILKEIMKDRTDFGFSISATSRRPRGEEKNGVDYYFFPVGEFKEKIANNEFLEYEEVYQDVFYGTLNSELDRIWSNGQHVTFDVDVVGGLNIKKKFGENALAIFIQPPSIQELENRLRGRSTDDENSIKKRLSKAEYELGFAKDFDKIIINDVLEDAVKEVKKLVNDFLA